MSEQKLLTITALCNYISTPVPTLYTWVCRKKIPYVKLGRSLRFDREEIDAWLNERKIAPWPH